MFELFKTVLILSLFGFGITALLLCLKPITAKKFPAKWQYYVWIAVLLSMIIPTYKLIPPKEAQKLPLLPQNEIVQPEAVQDLEEAPRTVIIEETPIEYREVNITPNYRIKLLDLLAYVWFVGMCIYLIVVISSYIIYLIRKHKKAIRITENAVLNEVKGIEDKTAYQNQNVAGYTIAHACRCSVPGYLYSLQRNPGRKYANGIPARTDSLQEKRFDYKMVITLCKRCALV